MIIFIRSTFNLTSTTFHSYIDVIADAKCTGNTAEFKEDNMSIHVV